jgi:hypothetical protein
VGRRTDRRVSVRIRVVIARLRGRVERRQCQPRREGTECGIAAQGVCGGERQAGWLGAGRPLLQALPVPATEHAPLNARVWAPRRRSGERFRVHLRLRDRFFTSSSAPPPTDVCHAWSIGEMKVSMYSTCDHGAIR